MELGRSERVHLCEVSPQQKHQAAVMDVQRVVVTVHLCGRKEDDQIITSTENRLTHLFYNRLVLFWSFGRSVASRTTDVHRPSDRNYYNWHNHLVKIVNQD